MIQPSSKKSFLRIDLNMKYEIIDTSFNLNITYSVADVFLGIFQIFLISYFSENHQLVAFEINQHNNLFS